MTAAFIQEIIPTRMREMGFGRAYRSRMITLSIPANGQALIRSFNIWTWFPYEMVGPLTGISVESNFGYLDFNSSHNEQAFEHTGLITVKNANGSPMLLSMIQAIPANPRHDTDKPIILAS